MQINKLKPHIDNSLPKAKWNFDLDDIDKILCIDSEENIILPIINLLKTHNFYCEEFE
ncbi:hypothetical protein AEQU3_01175 [Aequorivita antarctica]|nr:hypothetical protein AEQU3_01175 [Aequorivita antarctica]